MKYLRKNCLMLLCHVLSFTRQICHIMSYRYDTTKIDTLVLIGNFDNYCNNSIVSDDKIKIFCIYNNWCTVTTNDSVEHLPSGSYIAQLNFTTTRIFPIPRSYVMRGPSVWLILIDRTKYLPTCLWQYY